MRRQLVRSKPRLLTIDAVNASIGAGANHVSAEYENELGHTMAHISITVPEVSQTAGTMFYVYVLHDTPGGFENGSTTQDPSKYCVGAISAFGVFMNHHRCFDVPIENRKFKLLLRNEWGTTVNVSYQVATSTLEILE
ncbi:MAG: hypothetical protein PVH19_15500 [Planctomycetia bacterium]|jgi:hypothetical protein